MLILFHIRVSVVYALMIIIVICHNASAQPDILWTKTFGIVGAGKGNSVQQTFDGGYIIIGSTVSHGTGNWNAWLIKTDSSGDTLWTKTFGGSRLDYGHAGQQTSDGGYIITGSASGGTIPCNAWLIKTDSSGDTLWTKTFGGSFGDFGNDVQQTSDGGYIIIGGTGSYSVNDFPDAWFIKTDSSGDTLWTKTFGGSRLDYGNAVQQTSDGGYIIAGITNSYGNGEKDAWLVKTDTSGDTLWTRTFGGNYDDSGRDVQQTSDGGYIMTGSLEPNNTSYEDILLVKTDSLGNTMWIKTYGGESRSDDGNAVQKTSDGGYIIVGSSALRGTTDCDAWIIKTNAFGDTLWTKTFGGDRVDKGNSVQQTSDGGYIITGQTESYAWWGGYDVWLIRIASELSSVIYNNPGYGDDSSFMLNQNYPNPFNPNTTISYQLPKSSFVKLSIYDINGRLVETLINEHKNAGYYSVGWNAEKVSSGIYIYRINAGDFSGVKKCLIVK